MLSVSEGRCETRGSKKENWKWNADKPGGGTGTALDRQPRLAVGLLTFSASRRI
jgi:hypothetical protein